MKPVIISLVWAAVIAAMLCGVYYATWHANYFVVERVEHRAPPRDDQELVGDTLADKHPVFNDALVDSRPLGDWEVNASAAVIRLDCPMVIPDEDAEMLDLRPSYSDAIKAAEAGELNLLPSANMLDGAAMQFDDGLYAALDLACFRGEMGLAPAAPNWAAAVLQRLPSQSPARPFLAAALELAGTRLDLAAAERQERDRWLIQFEGNQADSKPIAFYTWTRELRQVWRFCRFLQHEFTEDDLSIPRDVAAVLRQNVDLRQHHLAINAFYGRLTNPSICLSVDALIDVKQGLSTLAKGLGARRPTVALFPPSTSRETELFDRMFPAELPSGTNLMRILIQRIRSGEVDLKPGKNDGWYQHKVYALETLLLPAKGQEDDKLLLTASYKQRLIKAFKALATKRRETHVRHAAACKAAASAPLARGEVCPRLRVEPCATFYLRNARAYTFLHDFLTAAVGRERLEKLHGLRRGGERPCSLDAELGAVRSRFYGFYLLACEDIGMQAQLADGELSEPSAARKTALDWLDNLADNADLCCDTRGCVPIFVDGLKGKSRIWASLGVRLAHLEASYAQPPRVRTKEGAGPWTDVDTYHLSKSRYVIPVDEFAEIELAASSALTREELREACNQYKTKEEIVRRLSGK